MSDAGFGRATDGVPIGGYIGNQPPKADRFGPLKDSGERRELPTGAERDRSSGKGRYDLLQYRGLRRVAVILEKGAEKYGARNWEQGMPLSWFADSAARHFSQFMAGDVDEDHLGQAAWNILCLLDGQERIAEGSWDPALNDLPERSFIAGHGLTKSPDAVGYAEYHGVKEQP